MPRPESIHNSVCRENQQGENKHGQGLRKDEDNSNQKEMLLGLVTAVHSILILHDRGSSLNGRSAFHIWILISCKPTVWEVSFCRPEALNTQASRSVVRIHFCDLFLISRISPISWASMALLLGPGSHRCERKAFREAHSNIINHPHLVRILWESTPQLGSALIT